MFLNNLVFGAPKIPITSLEEMEKSFPNLIVYAAPVMIVIAALEVFLIWYQEKDYQDKKETLTSLWVGLGNVVINFFLKSILLFPIVFLYNLVPWRMNFNWWTLLPCYIIFDLASYWAHRVSHSSRIWWATHVVHHSGEHYNLSVSFRLSWIQNFKIIFFMPVMLFGFHPLIFFITSQIAVLFQFWVHTEYIKKMPAWIEYIFATPSNHRVHHGSQEIYIDKNFGATFIFWDRIFGTYQPETEKVKYGITSPLEKKYNLLFVNFHEINDIWKDVKKTKGFKKKLYYIFGSPIAIANEEKNEINNNRKTT